MPSLFNYAVDFDLIRVGLIDLNDISDFIN
jgi:hypothetical protein